MSFDKGAFYTAVRHGILGPTIEPNELAGCEAILAAMEGTPVSHCAYALATAFKETNGTMQPVSEAYWVKNAEAWRKAHLRYYPWYGRDYVQTTWQKNYARVDAEAATAGLIKPGDILANPALIARLDIAAMTIRKGMEGGWFTGRSLPQHLPERLGTVAQFEQARRIINGMDCAHQIALFAMQFQDALVAGGWA